MTVKNHATFTFLGLFAENALCVDRVREPIHPILQRVSSVGESDLDQSWRGVPLRLEDSAVLISSPFPRNNAFLKYQYFCLSNAHEGLRALERQKY